MRFTPRLLFTIAGALIVLWPGTQRDAVADARALVGRDRVVFFSAEWCGYCNRLRKDLESAGIAFAEHDVDHSAAARAAWQRLGGRGVPLTLIGDEIVEGYNPERIILLGQTRY